MSWRVEIHPQGVWQKCWRSMGKHLWNGSIWTFMATIIYDDMTGQVDSYVAISIRADAGQPPYTYMYIIAIQYVMNM